MRNDRLTHAQLVELAELAPLQGLEPEEHRLLAEHLDGGCSECAERYTEGVAALDVLGLAVPHVAPTPESREALLETITSAREGTGSLRRDGWRVAFPALAAGVAVVLAVGSLFTARHIEHTAADALRLARAQMDARLAERDQQMQALSARLAHFEETLQARGESAVRELALGGEAAFVRASARVVVDRAGHQVLLLASELPPAPPGHTYQLWVIVSGAPHSLGVFDADDGGRALLVESGSFDLAADEFSVAVSVEPAGGVPQPTGPIVLVSH